MSNFESDLTFGNEYEKKTIPLIKHVSYEIKKGNFKPYDIIFYRVSGKVLKVEVKSDRMTIKTNNVAIEYECNGKPSGITSTEAKVWVHHLHGMNKYIKITTKRLKELIKGCRSVSGGDGYRSKLYLVSLDRFTKYVYDYP